MVPDITISPRTALSSTEKHEQPHCYCFHEECVLVGLQMSITAGFVLKVHYFLVMNSGGILVRLVLHRN